MLEALHLADPNREARVRTVAADFFRALQAWHQANDAQAQELWHRFNRARARHDQIGANAILAQIDACDATFRAQHNQFKTGLAAVLTPQQIETVEDVLTAHKVEVTFHAYQQIFPGLTADQLTFILKHLEAAREEAIDALSMKEKSAFFKKYKIRIEACLTAQRYNVKQCYREFVARLKTRMAAENVRNRSGQPRGPR